MGLSDQATSDVQGMLLWTRCGLDQLFPGIIIPAVPEAYSRPGGEEACAAAPAELLLMATQQGLCRITWPQEGFRELELWRDRHMPGAEMVEASSEMEPYLRQIKEYVSGVRREFTLPTDLRGTAFQRAVWAALCQIPYGCTISYSELALRVGRPMAVRAAGAANGSNPLPLVVPCHRAIGKNGALTGFRGGLTFKAALLRLEGALA